MLCTRRRRSTPAAVLDEADTSLALTGALVAPVVPVVLVGLSPVGLVRMADASERARRTRADDDDLMTVLPGCPAS